MVREVVSVDSERLGEIQNKLYLASQKRAS